MSNDKADFFFVIRHPNEGGLERWELDRGQPEPEFTVRREMGTTGSGYGNGSDTGVDA